MKKSSNLSTGTVLGDHVNPTLKAGGNLVKVAEYIEATADPIEQSPSVYTPAGQPPTPPLGNTGHGRANFWKAVLTAANRGLPIESNARRNRPQPAIGQPQVDPFFQNTPVIGQSDALWYGFEIRAVVQNAIVRFVNAGGAIEVINDSTAIPAGAPFGLRPSLPGVPDSEMRCYFSTQARLNALGQILPPVPFVADEFATTGLTQRFMGRFSIRQMELLRNPLTGVQHQRLQVVSPGPGNPVLLEVPLNLSELRKGGSSADPAISGHVFFDSWVFDIDTQEAP